jgi:tetratricopeptide (TPR) repeat protein
VTNPPARDRWLFGPLPDLLLGCGLGYAALFVLFSLAGTQTQGSLYVALVPLISILTGTPHYGATLIRVYEQRSERKAYAFFAFHATAVVWAIFYVSLYQPLVGSLLLTLYLSWSPWHYTGQNYGIALMFLRRAGVEVTPATKRALHLGFLLSFVLTLLATHGSLDAGEYAPVQPYQGGVFQLLRLAIPSAVYAPLFAGTALACAVSLGVAFAALLRRASPRVIAPAAALALTQLLWFSLPALARHFGGPGASLFAADHAATAFFWVATGHSLQYLWITTYFAARERPLRGRLLYLGKTLAAGSFIWGVPALLYTAALEGGSLGGVALGQDVFLVLAAAVNIHHFILDGAIWKLRDGRVARILIRREAQPDVGEPARRPWLAVAVYATGALATLAVLGSLAERQLAFEPALRAGDLAAAQRSLRRLDAFGYESAEDYRRVGRLAASAGASASAQLALEHSLRLQPQPATYVALARLLQHTQGVAAALPALEAGAARYPDHGNLGNLLGEAYLRLDQPERAVPVFEHLVKLAPDDERVRASLARARRGSRAREATPRDG